MSLDVNLHYKLGVSKKKSVSVFEKNITHNLSRMAEAAHLNLYKALWRPYQLSTTTECYGKDLIYSLELGLIKLKENKEYLQQFTPSNGWGNYDNLVEFVEEYLEACKEYPDALVFASV